MENVSGVRLSLLVDDYDKAIWFYCEQTKLFSLVANLDLGPDSRNVVLGYNNPKAPFCLVILRANNPDLLTLVGKQAGHLPLLVLPVNSCMDEYMQLHRNGVSFLGEPISLPYGCQATMVDPFGNKVCLSERY